MLGSLNLVLVVTAVGDITNAGLGVGIVTNLVKLKLVRLFLNVLGVIAKAHLDH